MDIRNFLNILNEADTDQQDDDLDSAPIKKVLGYHWIIDAYDCDQDSLSDVEEIKHAFSEAAVAAGMNIVTEEYHLFKPWGVSGATIVSESHLTVHTWPEHHYAAIDIFICGTDLDIDAAIDRLKEQFQWGEMKMRKLTRGLP